MPPAIVSIIDNDSPGVMVIPSDGATEVVEGGASDTYQVVLTYPPTQDVMIQLEHVAGQLTAVDAAQPQNSFLTFTSSNWDVPQNVLVTAVDDGVTEGTQEAYISHIIDTNDPDYQDAFALQELVVVREGILDIETNGTVSGYALASYGGQDLDPAAFAIEEDGTALHLLGNTWKRAELSYEVTPDTVIEFDFLSGLEGEVQAIGFDTNDTLSVSDHFFQLFGTQPWWGNQDFHDYSTMQGLRHYSIPIGRYFTGSFTRLVLTNDDDAEISADSLFNNIRIYDRD